MTQRTRENRRRRKLRTHHYTSAQVLLLQKAILNQWIRSITASIIYQGKITENQWNNVKIRNGALHTVCSTFFHRQLEQLEYRMVRDIGQILALLQQQNPIRGGVPVSECSPGVLESPSGQQQQKTLDVERPKVNFMETRSSCSLPTVAESRAESRGDSWQPAKGLSTQRSLDSASK